MKNGTVMAGQIAGLVSKPQTCEEIVKDLIDGAEAVLKDRFSEFAN